MYTRASLIYIYINNQLASLKTFDYIIKKLFKLRIGSTKHFYTFLVCGEGDKAYYKKIMHMLCM